jgi:D-alanyl-lipoteichoic acid acyltransferase DltB (MBOAT superfamily)
MLFNSLIFLVFLPCVFAIYWFLAPKWRNLFLLGASYYFYFSYNPWFLLLLIGTSALDFYVAKLISASEHPTRRKALLAFSIGCNIGVLFIFKYFIFFYNSISPLTTHYSLLNSFIIPAGLSFYTFQSISYTIDVYRNKYKADDTLTDFLLYVSFFPHMVAGPIVRYNSLMPQLKIVQYFKRIDWEAFAKLTVWGYFKKMVIADNLSSIVTPIFNDVGHYSGSTLLLAGFLFVVQVYADFSGYSDIATGVAKLFGINLSLNWRRPLFSKSLHEFWTRNHISITTWFRDYLYIGLGGNRVSYPRWLLNIFLVFLISGLWHGANFTFVVWGSMHGIVFILETLILKRFPGFKAPKFIGWLYLMSFHTLSLIAFRALSMHDLGYIYKQIFTAFHPGLLLTELTQLTSVFFLTVCALLIGLLFLKEANEEYAFLNKIKGFETIYKPAFFILALAGIFLLGNFNANQFIYFQF